LALPPHRRCLASAAAGSRRHAALVARPARAEPAADDAEGRRSRRHDHADDGQQSAAAGCRAAQGMVRRLNPSPWRALVRAGEPWQRRAGATAVLIGVLVVHGCVADQVAERMADFSVDAAMPPRIDVAYVREMELSKPPEAAPVAAPAPAAPKKTGVMRRPEQAASAASAAQDDVVAQATEPPPPEPAAAPDQPASAP